MPCAPVGKGPVVSRARAREGTRGSVWATEVGTCAAWGGSGSRQCGPWHACTCADDVVHVGHGSAALRGQGARPLLQHCALPLWWCVDLPRKCGSNRPKQARQAEAKARCCALNQRGPPGVHGRASATRRAAARGGALLRARNPRLKRPRRGPSAAKSKHAFGMGGTGQAGQAQQGTHMVAWWEHAWACTVRKDAWCMHECA